MDEIDRSYSKAPSFSDGPSTITDQIGLVFFFGATLLSVVVVLVCSFRQYVASLSDAGDETCATTFFAKICCHCRERTASVREDETEQYDLDRLLALALHRQLNEEGREKEREKERELKRKERRMWYEYYMKPYSVVISESNLFRASGNSSPSDDLPVNHTETEAQAPKSEGKSIDSDEDEAGQNADKRRDFACTTACEEATLGGTTAFDEENLGCTIACDQADEQPTLCLELCDVSEGRRCFDGTCALCIEEYCAGDTVVWSDLQCSHAFHKECLMQWLTKGKKRCPVCRHWFVPGTKIDDQKIAHGGAWQCALSEMQKREEQAEQEAGESEPGNGESTETVATETSDSDAASRSESSGLEILHADSSDSEQHDTGYTIGFDASQMVDIESLTVIPTNTQNETDKFCANDSQDGDLKHSGEP